MYKLWIDEREPCKLGLVDVGDNQLIWWCEHGLGACEELVKVLCSFPTHFGLEGRLYLPILEAFPVNASEESVFSDVPLSLRATAQTLGRVLGHQPFADGDSFFGQGLGVGHVVQIGRAHV